MTRHRIYAQLPKILIWSALLSTLYFCAVTYSQVPLYAAFSSLVFYIGWVLAPGFVAGYALTNDFSLGGFLALPLGIICHVAFFSLSLACRHDSLYSTIYPFFTVILYAAFIGRYFLNKSNLLPSDRQVFSCSPYFITVVAVSAAILLFYRAEMMDAANTLPVNVGQPAYTWPDIAFFMGNSAALKTHLFPPDFRIQGESLRYHFIFQQMLAACSKTFNLELFLLYSRIFPILLTIQMVVMLTWLGVVLRCRRWQIASIIVFTMLSAPVGWRVAFQAGWDLTLNYYTSPTILFGLLDMLALIVVIRRWRNFNPNHSRSSVILFLLFFTLSGIKLSVGVISLAALLPTLFWMRIRKHSCVQLRHLISAILGLLAAYAFYFLDTKGGMVRAAEIKSAGVLWHLLIATSPLQAMRAALVNPNLNFLRPLLLGVTVFTSFVFRHLPITIGLAVGLFYSFRRIKRIRPVEIYLLSAAFAGVAAAGLLAESNQPFHFYHQGIFCLAVLAAIGAKHRLPRSIVTAIVLASLLAMLPLIGDPTVPNFQGRNAEGMPLLNPTDLDVNILKALRDVRATSRETEIVVAGKTRLSNPYFNSKPYYFFTSAFSERQTYLEGWGFSKYGDIQYADPSAIEKREQLQIDFFEAQLSSQAQDFLTKSGATWVLWDQRIYGPPKKWVNDLFDSISSAGPVLVLRVKATGNNR